MEQCKECKLLIDFINSEKENSERNYRHKVSNVSTLVDNLNNGNYDVLR